MFTLGNDLPMAPHKCRWKAWKRHQFRGKANRVWDSCNLIWAITRRNQYVLVIFFLKGAWILTQQETTNRQLELSAIRSVIFIPRSLVLEDHSSCWWLWLWDITQLSNGRTQESGTSSPVLFPACDSRDDRLSNWNWHGPIGLKRAKRFTKNYERPRKPMKGTLGQTNKTMWHTQVFFVGKWSTFMVGFLHLNLYIRVPIDAGNHAWNHGWNGLKPRIPGLPEDFGISPDPIRQKWLTP